MPQETTSHTTKTTMRLFSPLLRHFSQGPINAILSHKAPTASRRGRFGQVVCAPILISLFHSFFLFSLSSLRYLLSHLEPSGAHTHRTKGKATMLTVLQLRQYNPSSQNVIIYRPPAQSRLPDGRTLPSYDIRQCRGGQIGS